MAKTYRAQCVFFTDSGLPRDVMQINPCFHDTGLGSNPDQLATDLAASLKTWLTVTTPITVKLYDVAAPKPVFPSGQKIADSAAPPVQISTARELALCLSYYADQNRPRHRGRLYIP